MSESPKLPTLPDSARGTARDFLDFAREELKRREGRGDDVDEQRYVDAVQMVLDRLAGPAGGTQA